MGEHAKYQGNTIKIGTCENLYYLRHDQRHLIQGYDFSEDVFRYRFPFPDEDNIEPGHFDDHSRGVRIPGGFSLADHPDHGHVQFTAYAGYNLCIPCPEQFGNPGFSVEVPLGEDAKLTVHRNGFNGGPKITQQRELDGDLHTIVDCGACGHKWRLTADQAIDVAKLFQEEAERQAFNGHEQAWGPANSPSQQSFLINIATRIVAGYHRVG